MLEVGTGFNQEMTGRENIYMNGAILGMTKAEVDSKLDQIIEFSECGDFIDTPVKRYSSGMFVKLAFAVAAHLDSEIMVMDEVLAVGDMKFQQKCLGKMSDVAGQEGRTVLYVSHNMSTIRQLCTRCVVLDKGKVKRNWIWRDDPRESNNQRRKDCSHRYSGGIWRNRVVFCVSSGCDQQDDRRKYTECRCSKWSNLFLQRDSGCCKKSLQRSG